MISRKVGSSSLRRIAASRAPAPIVRVDPSPPVRVVQRPRVGVIHNARARHNLGRSFPRVTPGCDQVMPRSHAELSEVLAGFEAAGIETLVIDGGDGTVRDIVSVLRRDLPAFRPRIAVVPSGKTNALALDLGTPADWTVAAAIDAAAHGRVEERAPIEVWRAGKTRTDLSGFILGGGAFVAATRTAQKTHRLGAFNGLAVGLSIAAAVGQTIFGGADNAWRRGERMRIETAPDRVVDTAQYLLLASTLTRLPLGIRPLGRRRAGLRMLRVEAPARLLALAAPAILAGREWGWLRRLGYHHTSARRIDVTLPDFVLDGETFEGGALSLRQGAPLSFVVP